MLNRISGKNFKSLDLFDVRLARLTLFAGENGAGKSTILQMLLLLKQIDFSGGSAVLHLNGSHVELGDTGAILHKWAQEPLIEITLTFDNSPPVYIRNDVKSGEGIESFPLNLPSVHGQALSSRIRYLGAHRIVPSDVFEYSTSMNATRDLGVRGEYSVAFLAQEHAKPLSVGALDHHLSGNFGIKGTLGANIDAWLQTISHDIRVTASLLAKTRKSSVSYGYASKDSISELSSENVGFGVTYLLPVILLVLSANQDDILIIENPESHVHPAGQVAIGWFLAMAAACGIQIVLETHSDHLFNGIRLYIKERSPSIDFYNFYYAERVDTSLGFRTQLSPVELYADGKIRSAPAGFFDAWEMAIFKLI